MRTFLVSLFLVFVMTAAICGLAFAWYVHSYINPSIEALDLDSVSLNLTSVIYAPDEKGDYVEYEKLHGEQNRIWADLQDIPQYMGDAFIAIEDQRFYSHRGVDWKRTLGATLSWVGGGSQYGGSTITQQLIKNLTDEKDYSVRRKINEIFRALALEKQVDGNKKRILEMYMNLVPFGNNAYGVQAAARTYFNKEVSQLSLAECAAIAGITNAPTKLNPFRHPENTKARQEIILSQMLQQGLITQSEYSEARSQTLNYQRPSDETDEKPYSYFTDTVITDLIADLQERKGYSRQLAEQMVLTGGLQIYATIDPTVQQTMEEIYAEDSNFPSITHNGKVPDSAMVILRPNGQVAGIVGGRGQKTGSRVLNRATQSKRQPGSSIKPIAVYGPAMDAGIITPYTGMEDEPYQELNGKPWPRNDNGVYSGPILLKNAVARSVNTIAVKTLAELTPEASFRFLTENLGMGGSLVASRTTSDGRVVSDVGLAQLGLGGLTDGVTVREMAGAYSIFVNDGDFVKPYTYTAAQDSKGNTILSNEDPAVIHAFKNEKTTYYMNITLQGVTQSGGTAASAKIAGMDTAGKTGTTTANRDRWFCGYTPYYVGACWVGYDDNYKLSGLGSNPATNLWKKVMSRIHEGLPDKSFPEPGDGFKRAAYCTATGLKPSAGCETATGWFFKGDEPENLCPGHIKVEENPQIDVSAIDPETGLPMGAVLNPDGETVTLADGTVVRLADIKAAIDAAKPNSSPNDPGTTAPVTPPDGTETPPGEGAGGTAGNGSTGGTPTKPGGTTEGGTTLPTTEGTESGGHTGTTPPTGPEPADPEG